MNVIITPKVKKLPKKAVVADFGCGEARLAQSVHRASVHSFDLVAANDKVIIPDICLSMELSHQVVACDMAKYTYTLSNTPQIQFVFEEKIKQK